ncbi:hypothetical protein NDN08_000311 [Rhodosorus marinus]|uniref:PROP1-like PPR domain-containing protein n=1 Tax=Rhodosorus marinus TaxID=101924 RepID=A0AAV8URL8_9RHOD|nr:hypothetical protein NDN08_000311 [Rhodosorus marinus]
MSTSALIKKSTAAIPPMALNTAKLRLQVMERNSCMPASEFEVGRLANALVTSRDFAGIRSLVAILTWKKSTQKVSAFTYERLVQGSLRHDELGTQTALRLYRNLFWRGIKPTSSTFAMIMARLTHEKKLDLALKVYAHFQNVVAVKDIGISNSLLSVLSKKGDLKRMRIVFDRIKMKGISPDVRTFTIFMDAHYRRGEMEGVQKAWMAMERRKIQPDDVAVQILLKSLGKLSGAIAAEDTLLSRPSSNAGAWEEVIAAYGRERNQRKSGEVFLKMVESGVKPSERTFVELARICQPESVLREMDVHSIPPTEWVFAAMMHRYAKVGVAQKALEIERTMVSRGIQPSERTQLEIARAFARSGNVDEVKSRLGKRNDLQALNTYIQAYCEKGDVSQAVEIFRCLLKSGHEPNERTYGYMIAAHARDGDAGGAELAYKELMEKGLKPYLSIFMDMVRVRHKAGDAVGLLAIYSSALEVGLGTRRLLIPIKAALKDLGRPDLVSKLNAG